MTTEITDKEAWLKKWIRRRGEAFHCWQEMHVEFPGKHGPRYKTIPVWQHVSTPMGAFRLARKYARKKARRVNLVFVGTAFSVWIGPDGSIEEIVDVRKQ